jgi:choline dehydrogenase-like flavoprotein
MTPAEITSADGRERVFIDARGWRAEGGVVRAGLAIIGAGAAGITLARSLIGRNVDVVVLESGGFDEDADTQDLYSGTGSGIPYFDLSTARLRFFGGSTNHWGGTSRPQIERDFVPRDGIPLSGWPIRRIDLAPYYDRASEICGLGRAVSQLDDDEARDDRRPLQLDPNEFETRFNGIVNHKDRSFARYRDELDAAANVAVHLWANVTGIVTDAGGGHVSSLEVATLSGNRYRVEATVVVLATGGIENARLLLASTAVDPRGVGNARDQVGRHFMEHPRLVAAMVVPRNPDVDLAWYLPHAVGGHQYQGYAAIGDRRQREEGLADVQIRLRPLPSASFERGLRTSEARTAEALVLWADGDGPRPLGRDLLDMTADLATVGDVLVPGGPLPVPLPDVVRRVLGASRGERESMIPDLLGGAATFFYHEGFEPGPADAIEIVARVEQVPNPDSRITLGAERDALGMPRAHLDWRLTDVERHSIIRSLELFGAELAGRDVGRLQLLLTEDGDWPADLSGGWHHMGTTRMSDDPADGVVDANGKVHGVDNLYVAGSSVFATAGSGTPTLTIVALTLRLHEHLTGRWFR